MTLPELILPEGFSIRISGENELTISGKGSLNIDELTWLDLDASTLIFDVDGDISMKNLEEIYNPGTPGILFRNSGLISLPSLALPAPVSWEINKAKKKEIKRLCKSLFKKKAAKAVKKRLLDGDLSLFLTLSSLEKKRK